MPMASVVPRGDPDVNDVEVQVLTNRLTGVRQVFVMTVLGVFFALSAVFDPEP